MHCTLTVYTNLYINVSPVGSRDDADPRCTPNPELIRSQGPVVLPGSYGWQPRVEAGGLTGKSWY